ncbi:MULTISPECIES: hypothetical protein [Rhodanobacter]|uniref:hypothetical protein n=1 Tax=Rhodanobacter TaxID=75309 RepID=UPI000486FF86|nr:MULTISPECIES: hypothetical protein [Rhodanobacter]KZC18578.1 ATP/GTP-binding protein [Rhodanobacter denitrificans]UJJ50233.1 ATP/GTP-binding protein [Rhodanobacter denitrificans]UJJ57575.1 ATP/GTP-binding protein [Rhodanobacter denitrificans]UJM92948.1 ATP/GTP-binding protein [Rhodanobacter denitrificans]UJM96478.1 ATP/GTP-binding protein [Rhodanobacter denitrificans]
MLAAKTFFETPSERLTPRMEEDFFTSLMTRNRTYKTTFHDRFSDINPYLQEYLLHHAPPTLRVLDVGISSGISTVELYDDLSRGGREVEVVGTDILIDAFLVKVFPRCYALVDPGGFPLRFDFPFVTMKPWVTRDDYYNGLFILRKFVNTLFTHQVHRMLRNPDDARISEVKLVTPRALAKSGITVCTDDISRYNSEFEARFDFVRAANVLNSGYFSPTVLSAMVANIGCYLTEPEGSLLVVRTHEDRASHGTLFRRGNGRHFEAVHRFGSGSEVEDIVLRVEIPTK